MSSFQIFSDGSCDIPLADLAKYNIKTIPFYVSVDNENYAKELEELELNQFYDKIINEKIYPKTSLPSVQDYMNAFTPVLQEGRDVICYTITLTLSGSYQSASTAKQILEETYPDAKIYIVNSWLATGAQQLLLFEAVKMRDAGRSVDEVYKISEELKKTGRIIFMVGTLDYLEHGGRIGKLASLSGKILNIKPLILLDGGEINVAGVSQSRKKGIKKLSALTKAFFEKIQENPMDYTFLIGTTNTWNETEPFQKMILEDIPGIKMLPPFQIGATISTHTGPDTIGICFLKNYEKL